MKIITTILAATCILLSSCSDAERARIGGLGSKFKVEMYSGGVKVREWISTGKVVSEHNSDGYYFNDQESGKLIEISGDVVISPIK